jgi:hypothetical protein
LERGLRIVEVQLDPRSVVRRQLRLDTLLNPVHSVEHTPRLRIRRGDK